MKLRSMTALVSFVLFCASIPLANWTLDRYGMIDVPWLGPIPAGTAWIALAFVARDVVQRTAGKLVALTAIAIGLVLSVWLADPGLAAASAWAFLLSELLDFAIYTPLAERRFTLAVLLSSIAGSMLDSALFLWIAFDSTDGWWQLAVAKTVIIFAATPIAAGLRMLDPDPVPA